MNKPDIVITQTVETFEGILREMVYKAVCTEEKGNLTIRSIEAIQKEAVSKVISLLSGVSGNLLSSVEVDDTIESCDICGHKTILAEQDAQINEIRDRQVCRRCHKGYGVNRH